MEYRGYDSAGIAVWTEDGLEWRKKAGKLSNLEAELAQDPVPVAHLGIGHTRWATHGAPTDTNAHPHVSSDGRIALIHNGIIENFASLRAELESSGIAFTSQTDSEVAAQLIAREVGAGAGLAEAMRMVSRRLEGTFTLVAMDAHDPDLLVAARRTLKLPLGFAASSLTKMRAP